MSKGNRLRGLRANAKQVEKFIEEKTGLTISQMKDLGMKQYKVGETQVRVNRAMRRRKFRARFFENADDKIGKPFTAKGVIHNRVKPVPTSSDHTPDKDPKENNHQRVVRQRTARKQLLEAQR